MKDLKALRKFKKQLLLNFSHLSDTQKLVLVLNSCPGFCDLLVRVRRAGCWVQWLQTALWERHKVRTIRRTLAEVAASARLDADGNLCMEDIPVAVAYYRAGYSPTDYGGPAEWRAR